MDLIRKYCYVIDMKRSRIILWCRILGMTGLLFTNSHIMGQNVESALRLLETEKFQSAVDAIQEVLKETPGQADTYFYAGYIYLQVGKPDSARYFFDTGIRLDDRAPLNYVGLGYLDLKADDGQAAQVNFGKALSLSKERDPVVFNKIADAWLHAGNNYAHKALSYLDKAMALKKKKEDEVRIEGETLMLMGDANLDLGRGGEAVTSYERAFGRDARLGALGHTKIGRIYLSAHNHKAALMEFEKAVQLDPTYAPVYKDLGEIYFTYEKDVGKAKEMYGKYLGLSDVKTGSRSRYAAFLYVSKDYENAIKEIREGLRSEPGDIVMNRLLGYALYLTKDYEGAEAAFKKYFDLVGPTETLASDFEYHGMNLMELGKDSLAMENFYTAIEKDSSKTGMLEHLAQAYKKLGKYRESANLYERYLERKKNLGPNDYYAAGTVFLEAGLYDRADTAFAKVIQLFPDHYVGYYMMANTKFYQDQEDKQGSAKPYFEKVIEILESDKVPKNVAPLITAYSYMATYYTKREDLKMARTYWEKVKAMDPENTNAKRFFDYLQEVEAYRNQKKGPTG